MVDGVEKLLVVSTPSLCLRCTNGEIVEEIVEVDRQGVWVDLLRVLETYLSFQGFWGGEGLEVPSSWPGGQIHPGHALGACW